MSANEKSGRERRRSERYPVDPEEITVGFLVEPGHFNTAKVDVSETGIGFTTTSPIGIKVHLRYKDGSVDRTGSLVWASHTEDDEMRYGFHFDPLPEDNPNEA